MAGDERVREERPLRVERREGEGVRVGVDVGSVGLLRREGRVREGRVQRRHVLLRGSLLGLHRCYSRHVQRRHVLLRGSRVGLHCYSRHVQEGCHAHEDQADTEATAHRRHPSIVDFICDKIASPAWSSSIGQGAGRGDARQRIDAAASHVVLEQRTPRSAST